MVDFITLVIGYLIFCIFCFCIYVYWEESWLQKSVFVTALRSIWKTTWRLMPRFVRSGLFSMLGVFIYQRNHLFQVVYAVCVAAGHMVLVLDALPVLYHYAWHQNHVFLPLLFAFSNGLLYAATMLSDPGIMTEKICFKYSEVYSPDRILYKPNNRCTTCNLTKPARSKHCAICDHCVHRFDHHCVWTNCCIGGMNYRYFLGFLVSLVAMCANAAVMGIQTLVWQVSAGRLWEAQWLDDEGVPQPMTYRVLIQHLFMQHPRLVFIITSMIPLTVALCVYCCYHFFLVIRNQTTNERYKWSRYLSLQLDAGRKLKFDMYDQGFRRNVSEVLQPYRYLNKDKIYRSKWR